MHARHFGLSGVKFALILWRILALALFNFCLQVMSEFSALILSLWICSDVNHRFRVTTTWCPGFICGWSRIFPNCCAREEALAAFPFRARRHEGAFIFCLSCTSYFVCFIDTVEVKLTLHFAHNKSHYVQHNAHSTLQPFHFPLLYLYFTYNTSHVICKV